MTNSQDFRRYSYTADASSALHAFEAQRSSAAPAYPPVQPPQPNRGFRVRENPKQKSRNQLKAEQKRGFGNVKVIIGVALTCIVMFCGVLYTNAQKNELSHKINSIQKELAVANSENVRLTSELDALVSVNMIEQYAVENLGMTKIQARQIHYIDVAEYKEKRQKTLDEKASDAKADTLEE